MLVVGGTGLLGGLIADTLIANGEPDELVALVRALCRRAQAPRVRAPTVSYANR